MSILPRLYHNYLYEQCSLQLLASLPIVHICLYLLGRLVAKLYAVFFIKFF